jgi:hypothetical protein
LSGDIERAISDLKKVKILKSLDDIWKEYEKVIEKAAISDDLVPLS